MSAPTTKIFDNITLTPNFVDNQVEFESKNHIDLLLMLDYTKGDESQMNTLIEVGLIQSDETVIFYPLSKLNESTGAVESVADLFLNATGLFYVPLVKPKSSPKVRISVNRTGGSGTGVVTVSIRNDSNIPLNEF